MKRLIKKYQLGKELVAKNDAILHVMPPVKSIIWTREPKSPDASIHEIQLNPDGSIGGIGISYPGLTDLLLKDKSAVERLHGRPYTNRLFLSLQRKIHNSNVRDIDSATKATGAIMTLASMLSGAARFGGNPGITSSGVKLIPALDPGNIAGYANAAGLVTADPYNIKTYTNPDVWTAVLPFLPKYAKLNPKTGKYSKDGVVPSGLASFGTSEHLYDIDNALINLLLADLKSNPHSYLSRVLRGEVKDPDYLKAVEQIESGNYPFFSKVGALPNALQLIEAAAQGNENRVYAAVRKGLANYPGRTGYAPRVDEKSGVDFGGMVYLTSSPEVAIN